VFTVVTTAATNDETTTPEVTTHAGTVAIHGAPKTIPQKKMLHFSHGSTDLNQTCTLNIHE